MPQPYHASLMELVRDNQDFRRVLHTGARSQLVAMAIPAGGEVGQEQHDHVEQTFLIQQGHARATVEGRTIDLEPGMALVVPPATAHNIVVVGDETLKLATIYAPPNHLEGRIHATKADADADAEDEAFGERVR